MKDLLLPGFSVLITAATAQMRTMLGDMMRRGGYETVEADSGVAALIALRHTDVRVVLLHNELSEMTDWEDLSQIRKGNPHIAILVITKVGTVRSAVEAIRRGADDYLVLPVWFEELILAVENAQQRRASSREPACCAGYPMLGPNKDLLGKLNGSEGAPRRDSGTLAVLIQERWIRSVLAALLRAKGYEVLEMRPEEEAIQRAVAYPGPLRLLITDAQALRTTGPEVFHRLAQNHQNLSVIYYVQPSRSALDEQLMAQSDVTILARPFQIENFLEKVRTLLEIQPIT
jgi:DNA-binding NtrC family response regulator